MFLTGYAMNCVEIKAGGRRNGLSILQESRLRERLRREVPSEPWLEAQFSSFTETDGRGRQSVRRVHNPSAFPPGGQQTGMVRCPLCGVFTPPIAFEAGACLDHAEHESWGASPSALAIRGLQFRNLRMADEPLLPETTAALRSEILHFELNPLQAKKRRRKF
jgi:hypothetical protein